MQLGPGLSPWTKSPQEWVKGPVTKAPLKLKASAQIGLCHHCQYFVLQDSLQRRCVVVVLVKL